MVKSWGWRNSGSFARQDSTSAWRICGGALFVTGVEESLMPKPVCAWLVPCKRNTSANEDSCCRFSRTPLPGRRALRYFNLASSSFTQEPQTSANMYRTFVLDLAPPIEELRRNLDEKWRNKLTRSEKNGLKVVAGNGTDEYRTFCRMYNQMWKRKTFETTVDVEEFGRLQEDLPETHRMRILICEQDGVPVAGLVASAMGDSAIYLLGATSDDGLNAKGAYLLQWTLIQWLKENGIQVVRLGGHRSGREPGCLFLQERIVRRRRVSINSAGGVQQCCLFCGRQGKPGGAACGAELGHSAAWSCPQINRVRRGRIQQEDLFPSTYINATNQFSIPDGDWHENARR